VRFDPGERVVRRAVVALLLLASLAACGGREAKPEDLQAVPARIHRAGTAAIAIRVSVGVEKLSFNSTGTGVVDFAGRRARLTLRLAGVSGAPGSIAATPAVNIVTRGKDFYVRLGNIAGGKWIKIGGTAAGAAAQQGFFNTNPSEFVEYLRGADDVTELGTEAVRGEQTRHYLVAVDLEKASSRSPPAERDAVRAAIAQLGAAFPMDVWLAGDGLPRRFSVTLTPRGAAVRIQVEMFDFGKPVTVKVPAPSAVIEANTPEELARIIGAQV
jgi:hypothetical protein